MNKYWDNRFKEGKVWGAEPSCTARSASIYFKEHNKSRILVIGSGYGRNANYFFNEGFEVDGIEYSLSGIEIARTDNPSIPYYHGSVFDMPFSEKRYSAIYCYNVIHLFMKQEREALVSLCGQVLENDGLMYFSAFSDEDESYGEGKELEVNTFEVKPAKPVHFYNQKDLKAAFGLYTFIDDGICTETVGSKKCKLRYIVAQNRLDNGH